MPPARLLAGVTLVAALALLSADGLSGQDKAKNVPEAGKTAARGKLPPGWDRLGLTDAQAAEVIRLTAEYRAKIEPLQEELGRLKSELARKRVALLSDEQKRKLADGATTDPAKDRPKEKAGPGERPKEKPKAKGDPDK